MCTRPPAEMAMNHKTMIGPNRVATAAVPRDWAANKAMRITADNGSTISAKDGETSFNPSTAERTEIAGVMTASP